MKMTFKNMRAGLIAAPLMAAASVASAGGLSDPVVEPAPMPTPVVAPVVSGSDWSGFYAGGQLGFGQLRSDVLTEDPDGMTYGVHAGYLYDLGSVVLGAELDFDATDIEDLTADVALDSVTRAKLRVGYDAGNFMPYLTGGVAQANVTSGTAALNDKDTGAFGGIGLEYRVSDSMRVGGEVLKHQFDDFNDSGVDLEATTAALRVSFAF